MAESSGLIRFFQRLAETTEYAVLLGGPTAPSALNRWALMGLGARQVLRLSGQVLTVQDEADRRELTCEDPSALFAALRSASTQARTWDIPELPFHGGLMGVCGYGFYPWCDAALWPQVGQTTDPVFPELLLVECRDWLMVDLTHPEQSPTVLSDDPEAKTRYLALWEALGSQAEPVKSVGTPASAPHTEGWRASFEETAFEAQVAQVQAHIRAGDLYQANLSIRFQRRLQLDPYRLFADLCARNPSPFSGLFKFPEGMLVCNSPERLVNLDRAGRAETRPIAGTRGRGCSPEEEAAIGASLLENEKERAEHLMLVDLERNDLGRVCRPGSVEVTELMALERYSHVTHLVSNVAGQLAPDKDAWDLLAAMFPGGTITGCPKIRCIELLNRYEPAPRGWYTGSLGYVDALTGATDWNILIRSLYLAQERPELLGYNAAIHAGAGIVADSVGAHEYRECGRKAQALLDAIQRHAQTVQDEG